MDVGDPDLNNYLFYIENESDLSEMFIAETSVKLYIEFVKF